MLGQFHSVVGDELVDVAILVSLGLGMADQYDHLRSNQPLTLVVLIKWTYAGFPHVGVGGMCGRRGFCRLVCGQLLL